MPVFTIGAPDGRKIDIDRPEPEVMQLEFDARRLAGACQPPLFDGLARVAVLCRNRHRIPHFAHPGFEVIP